MSCVVCFNCDIDMKKLSDAIKQGLATFSRRLYLRSLGGQLVVAGYDLNMESEEGTQE
ncbi:hypothetical protein RvY_02965 [Ramazzottius varieornatus]|uniref:Uncharacterized protein n=1 Tax=Ramazzottius varieornatus TaxID=947166 RepID=A0A1D1ULI3_RAMVA|nr:hypothetical protein RvY_02965 [Ramazzottius varieornatus]